VERSSAKGLGHHEPVKFRVPRYQEGYSLT
jgi:hypothetical protein